MSTFEAHFYSDCGNCGWRIKRGDLARYDTEGDVVHVVCPEDVGIREAGEVCGVCFIEKSATGVCGCDE